ncbi:plexin-B2-like isoform X2 [Stigmatopora nigra]
MERRPWWWCWLFLATVAAVASAHARSPHGQSPQFLSDTSINNVVRDGRTGRLYVGAVNAIYQLSADLRTESRVETGPRRDNRQCTPPITDACEEAVESDNHNKLLLVHGAQERLVACGSLFRGICSLVNLSRVEQVLYFVDNKGEKTYVASTDHGISVVGVMSYFTKDRDNFTVFMVAKGYGGHDSTKLISTRILRDYGEWNVFENVVDASSVQANPFVLRYQHDFRLAFKDGSFVYFLFSRTLGVQDSKNVTFVARMCEDDQSYYSYTELQLNCSAANKFNKVQAAYVSTPGEVLAQNLSRSGRYGPVLASDKVLFVAFSSDREPGGSAVCMYPVRAINARLLEIIGACYGNGGLMDDKPAVYFPYSSKSDGTCSGPNRLNMAQKYKCGAEFLPSPLAGSAHVALTAEPSLVRKGVVTAVAVAVEMGHAVAFLGTANGEVLKLHLSAQPEIYGLASAEATGGKVNKDLLLDSQLQHLYIVGEKKISKVPVQACHLKSDCRACVALKDPYCGWCVLEGRCTRKHQCARGTEDHAWLWSPDRQCVEIRAFRPPNLSCRKTQQVDISVPALPRLRESDRLRCLFGSWASRAVAVGSPAVVTCSLPDPAEVPPAPAQRDYVSVPLQIVVNDQVVVTTGEFHFYDCAATAGKNPNTPCISCVTSEWGCQWNAREHRCGDTDGTPDQSHIVKPQQPERCPQFQWPRPLLIPVGVRVSVGFRGSNLDIYSGRKFVMGTELMKQTEEEVTQEPDDAAGGGGGHHFKFPGFPFSYDRRQEVNVSFHVIERDTGRKIDSTLTVLLYNCSVGREDCSLCRHAHAKYDCVWCASSQSCVYRGSCPTPPPALCPKPQITDIWPRFGPLNGRIAVTIGGSNMGVKKEDIKRISVAGVECQHLQERYSVSTRVVCEIGPAKRTPPSDIPLEPGNSGAVVVEVDGGRTGKSQVFFTYRDPRPEAVHPGKGPAAGGTAITIVGRDLDTASRGDVSVSVGGVPCPVLSFGEFITCRTGPYGGQKLPSQPLALKVLYGRNTSKEVAAAFRYTDNPKISDYNPKSSFVCGGRRIVVTGNGFDLIQRASLKVAPATEEFSSPDAPGQQVVQDALSKNDSVLEFLSPAVNWSDGRPLLAVVQLDQVKLELEAFAYHPDPSFDKLSKMVVTETSVIIVTGRGFAKATTAAEARAFVGDAPCNVSILQDDRLILDPPSRRPRARSRRHRREAAGEPLELVVMFGHGEWKVGSVYYGGKEDMPLAIIVPAVVVPMLLFVAVSVYCYRRKSRQAEREYEKVKNQLDNLEESVRDRCKKEFTDLMIEMEDHTSEPSEARIPFLDYKTYTERNLFLPSKDGGGGGVLTGHVHVPEFRRAIVTRALEQFSNLLNSKPFLINFIHTLESCPDFNARARGDFASLLTVALHGKLVYFTDITRTLLLELVDQHVHNKHPKLMLRRSETVVERMLCNWMSICLYQFLRDSAGEPLYKLFKALKHQVEKGPVDAKVKKAKYTLNDTGLLGDDVEYSVLTLQVLVHGEGADVTPVKVLNCDTISQVKEKIIDQVYRNLPYSQRPKAHNVALEWRPGSTGQILSDLDLTSQKEGRWKRLNTLAHYNVRDNATLVLSKVLHSRAVHQHQDHNQERNALPEDDDTFHLVRAGDELDEVKSRRGGVKDKSVNKAITEIYLTRLLSVKGTLQTFVDDFFRSILRSSAAVPPAVKYFFDFLDEQALRHDNVDEETLHVWKTNSLPLRFWVNILRNPHFILDVHVTEVVDASLHVIALMFMDACTKTEHKLSRESPSNKLLYAKEISTYKKMVDDYYKGIRQMVPVSDQDMNTYLAEVSRQHTDELNTQQALHQLYQYASKYYDAIIRSLDQDPAAQKSQLTLRLQQIAADLEDKVTDL